MIEDLLRAGLRLEAAAADLARLATVEQAEQIECAMVAYQLEKDEFRSMLENVTQLSPDIINRWLAL